MNVISDAGWLTGASCDANTQPSLLDLGRQLRELYRDVESEAVPETLAAVARQLDCGVETSVRTTLEAGVSAQPGNWQPLIRSDR